LRSVAFANHAGLDRSDERVKLPEKSGENDSLKKEKRQFGETMSMESLNETNGIVQRFQWNCLAKPMDLSGETGEKEEKRRRKKRAILAVCEL